VGGRTLRSLRRAVALTEGWAPFAVTPDQAKQWLDRVELPAAFDVVLHPATRLDPVREPARTQDILAATAAAGATIISVGSSHETLGEYLDYIEALAVVNRET
jgi:hypothetical protein